MWQQCQKDWTTDTITFTSMTLMKDGSTLKRRHKTQWHKTITGVGPRSENRSHRCNCSTPRACRLWPFASVWDQGAAQIGGAGCTSKRWSVTQSVAHTHKCNQRIHKRDRPSVGKPSSSDIANYFLMADWHHARLIKTKREWAKDSQRK